MNIISQCSNRIEPLMYIENVRCLKSQSIRIPSELISVNAMTILLTTNGNFCIMSRLLLPCYTNNQHIVEVRGFGAQ